MNSDMVSVSSAESVPRFCVERNSVARTKMMIRTWELLRDRTAAAILDVGCGDSSMWVDFLEGMPHVDYYGVEPSSSSAARARARLPRHADRIKVGRGEDIGELFDRKFDVLVSRSVLEHVVHRARFIEAISSALEPGGVILMTWGNGHFRQGWLTDLRNVVSQGLAIVGNDKYYAAAVAEREVIEVLGRNGMLVEQRAFLNIDQVKFAHKLVSNRQNRDECMLRWLSLEEGLNNYMDDDGYLGRIAYETYMEITHNG